jgi:arylsulfatase A-like enzyme
MAFTTHKNALFAGIAWALPVLWAISTSAADPTPRPNILLIVADDLGYADVGIHGCKEFATPHIDAIANGGVRFTSAYVSGAVCAPSRAGFLTGRYQDRFGFQGNPAPGSDWGLPVEEKTIADRLKSVGYRTALLGKWHLGEKPAFHPMTRGFDEFFGFLSGMHDFWKADDPEWGAILRGREKVELKEYLTFALAREACAFLERKATTPFFLFLSFNAPHTPLQAPPEYIEKVASIQERQRRIYAAMVMALDDAVGRVMHTLRAQGLEENTLVFFFSDNGGPTIEGAAMNGSRNDPLRGSKAQLWEGGIRVPFFIQWKGLLPAGKIIDTPIIALDMAPTALAAAGVTPDPAWKLDGLNLLPLLQGDTALLNRDRFFWKFGAMQYALRMGDLKRVKVTNRAELFNLRTDIGEKRDLSSSQPEIAADMDKTWEAWAAANPPAIHTGKRGRKAAH